MRLHEILSGFQVTELRQLDELNAEMVRMRHVRTGLELVWLNRAEENKTFGIAFRTLPWDDTGVFHILEHSVLCGSRRYPVKEPFVELMKSSMSTFLNAMTFPDKTFYPVSSRNEKDFLNLIQVYLDAVLHPLIYSHPEIFEQEGWHYEQDGEQGEPVYQGVVFNEMKGALASPDSLMQSEMNRLLFPDTCYRYVSGGDPAHIPELTYEQFLDSHRRFYHPSNARIFLDGNMDVETVLSVLDEFLGGYTRAECRTEIPLQAPVKPAPVRAFYESSPSDPAEGRARLAWGYVLGDYSCREEQMAARVLADALCGSNQAPLSQRMLSQGLAQDVRISVMDGIRQPYVMLEVRNLDESRRGEVEAAVRDELRRLVGGGLDHEHLAAILANLEFQLRERDYGGMPQGIGLGMDVLDSWLYGGDPAANLEISGLFRSLNRKLEEGWFEGLLERVFLDNPHSCQVLLAPSATLGEEKRERERARLRLAWESWSDAERANLQERQRQLDAWQVSEDLPEALATLPQLSLTDISARPEEFPTVDKELAGRPLLRHQISTGGISYVNLYFDISDFSREQLSGVSFLCRLLGDLDTTNYSSMALQKLCRRTLGNLFLSVKAYGGVNVPESCRAYLCVSFSALEEKLEDAAALVAEIITGTRFDNHPMIRELLRQSIAQMEQGIVSAGSSFAVTRVSAGCSAQGVVREVTGGFAYYQWLKALESEFDSRAVLFADELAACCPTIFARGRMTVSVTGTGADAGAILARVLLPRLSDAGSGEIPCAVRPWGRRREGIVIPADVSFAALGGSLLAHGGRYCGAARVLGRITGLAYLWNTIRVQGGAYGTGLAVGDSGNAVFYSYRDPNAARSLGCYRQAADFVEQLCAANPDLSGFIIGAVAESDPLLLPSRRGETADEFYLKGVRYEDRCRVRQEMLSAAPDTLGALAEPLRALSAAGGICVIGSRRQIEDCGAEIDTVYTL